MVGVPLFEPSGSELGFLETTVCGVPLCREDGLTASLLMRLGSISTRLPGCSVTQQAALSTSLSADVNERTSPGSVVL